MLKVCPRCKGKRTWLSLIDATFLVETTCGECYGAGYIEEPEESSEEAK